MTPEHRDISDWARRERQADLGWIAESLNVVSAVAPVAFVDTSHMVAEYDPTQEFVIVLLKHEDRTSTDWVGFVPPGRQSVKRQASNVIGFRKRYLLQQIIQHWIAFTDQLASSRLFSKCAVALLRDHSQEELDYAGQQLQAVLEDGLAQDVTCKYQPRLSLAKPRAYS